MRALSLLIVTVIHLGILVGANKSRPYELLIFRNRNNSDCTFATLKSVQEYRGLAAYGHLGTKELNDAGERLRFVQQYRDEAWSQLLQLCGPEDSWDFPVLTDTAPISVPTPAEQDVLAVPELARGFFPLEFELEPLVKSGHSSNRVDLMFFADGYTRDERDKFIEDAYRLAMDISSNQTFYTVKPLLNFGPRSHLAQSTPFGLYRDGTELRAVYYAKPEIARAACFYFEDKCDYPILMGNDPLYGGLGGEFTVITPSLANGALVLRHELGHSIIDVGEEYDGGPDYFGVNAHHNLSEPISWAHWFTNASHTLHQHEERSVMPMQAYPWTMLNTSAPWSIRSTRQGCIRGTRALLALWAPAAGDLKGDIGEDRWHYDIHRDDPLSAGEHDVEFGDEEEFVTAPGFCGVFPTFSDMNETTYRPTNEDCLMRIVTTPNFCKVCLEGLWLALLRRVDLIDDMPASCVRKGCEWTRRIELNLVPLGQFREEPVDVKESYSILWTKDGEVLEEFTDQKTLEVADGDAAGVYTAHIRVDKAGLTKSQREYKITGSCDELN
ncbi:IgA peptidase M64-domain-containing protein [Fomitopsis serialis]|uniref:IgA peptidase M64-domain-containing protein n=1 Tax=Fomitopsis serialis TaxID=139415 RepID=UPI00200799D2|nr:IgA peptidase M64-domain-containing protein [Neoantrodia serialis]KAH9922948.1 IgA peptidase M64-domain-containing protein [Neoantrodia serialis]